MPVLVGTASWTDKTLIACGRFYPKDATQRRGAAALLRVALPAGRGRFELLRDAGARHRATVGRAHAGATSC